MARHVPVISSKRTNNGHGVGFSYLFQKQKLKTVKEEGRKRHARECEREHVAAIEVKRIVAATKQQQTE
jgi:hypothetical protein